MKGKTEKYSIFFHFYKTIIKMFTVPFYEQMLVVLWLKDVIAISFSI